MHNINSRYITIAAYDIWCHLVMSLFLAMSYCTALYFAAKLTKIENVRCLGTMRERGHSKLLNENQAKIVKALTCYLCP